jgi:hypothetical protein
MYLHQHILYTGFLGHVPVSIKWWLIPLLGCRNVLQCSHQWLPHIFFQCLNNHSNYSLSDSMVYLMWQNTLDMGKSPDRFIDMSCNCCMPCQLLGKSKETLLYYWPTVVTEYSSLSLLPSAWLLQSTSWFLPVHHQGI